MSITMLRALPALFLFALATTAGAETRLDVAQPVLRLVPPFMTTTAAFMSLTNPGTSERLVVAASTPAAAVVELHMHTNDDGVMRMRRIPHIHLPPGKEVRLQPGGMHLMVFDLKAPIKRGQTVPFELELDDGSRIRFDATVGDVKPMH